MNNTKHWLAAGCPSWPACHAVWSAGLGVPGIAAVRLWHPPSPPSLSLFQGRVCPRGQGDTTSPRHLTDQGYQNEVMRSVTRWLLHACLWQQEAPTYEYLAFSLRNNLTVLISDFHPCVHQRRAERDQWCRPERQIFHWRQCTTHISWTNWTCFASTILVSRKELMKECDWIRCCLNVEKLGEKNREGGINRAKNSAKNRNN